MDYIALKNKLKEIKASKFPDHPTEKQYENNASYYEDGKPKFPIRENAPAAVVEKDISDAKKLEHHVSPADQTKVEENIKRVEEKRDLAASLKAAR